MELEFEVMKDRWSEEMIVYNVYRKGLNVGMIVLSKPYNKEEIKRVSMVLR